MNLKQMEYFVAAAEQLNFTRAAKKCFISQTAMTLQIRSLEEKIGVPLFVRDKHHVELTAAGGLLLFPLWEKELVYRYVKQGYKLIQNLQTWVLPAVFNGRDISRRNVQLIR